MSNIKFSYDKENDDLFLFYEDSKSSGSVELGDFILDFDNKKNLVGVQIINASKSINDFVKEDVEAIKEILDDLKDVKLEVVSKHNMLIIKIFLISKSKEIVPVVSVPNIMESSPAIAAA